LGFCSLAAALRERFPALHLEILDCTASQVGWHTLERKLRQGLPDVVCIGEETVSSVEGRRLAGLAKEIDPEAIVIAGGVYFSYTVEDSLAEGNVDYIVCGEGEATLVELVSALVEGRDPADIQGLAYRHGNGVRINPHRPPITDMDSLPRPAYDLLAVEAYGRGSRNHPNLASLEHGRGCVDRCNFCILWKHFGRWVNGTAQPCYRTKSAERSFQEVDWLARDYGRRTIHFVDPTFNVDPRWTDRFSDLMLASGLPVQFTAWMRADFIVRDEELGILEKLVRAGLVQVYIGIERVRDDELARLDKHHNGPEITRKAFEILRTRYPEVFTIGTVIYGMPWETRETLAELRDFQFGCPLDCVFYIPLSPNPGTELRQALLERGYRMSADFSQYDFLTPVMDTDHLDRRDLENFYSSLLLRRGWKTLTGELATYFAAPTSRKRRLYRRLASRRLKLGARQLMQRVLGPLAKGPALYAGNPEWYDS
jgi:radical SAM superfamily enzyme YgiQ (UPF0313 family)